MTDLSGDLGHDKLAGDSTHFPRRGGLPPPFDKPPFDKPGREVETAVPPPLVSPMLLLDTLRRRKLSLVITTLLGAGAGGAVVQATPNHYLATATLMVEDRKPSLSVLPTQSGVFGTDSVAARTQVDLLRTSDLAKQVAVKLDLPHAGEFARKLYQPVSLPGQWIARVMSALNQAPATQAHSAGNDMQAAADMLRDKTIFVNDGRSYVIEIQVRTEDAALSAAIANAYAGAYLNLKTRIKSEGLERASARFAARLNSLAEQAGSAERAVQNFRIENGLVEDRAAAAGVTVVGQQMAQMNAQLISASNERARLEATLAQIRGAQFRGTVTPSASNSLADLPDVLASPLIQRLQEQQAGLAGREANLASTHGASDPELMSLRAARQAIDRKITIEVNRVISSLAVAAEAARVREGALRADLVALLKQVSAEGRASVELMGLQNAANAARAVYVQVLNRSAETANEVDAQEPDAVLVSLAEAPLAPAFPSQRVLLILDLAGAPVVALLIALVRDRLRPGLRGAEAVEALTGIPCLGFVPSRRGRRGRAAFDHAVAALPAVLGRKRPRVLLLTAAMPGEGTSVLAEALARAVALAGARVLLVICGRGFAPTAMPMANLEIITATPAALPNAPRNRYDLILLDTPAVLAASLTLSLVAMADATILVIRFGHTPAAIVTRAVQTLRRYGGHLVGTVVTRVERGELSARDGSELYLDRARRRRRESVPPRTTRNVIGNDPAHRDPHPLERAGGSDAGRTVTG